MGNCDEMLVQLSVWSEVQVICMWSSWWHCHLVISCFIKIQIVLTFLVLAYPGCPGKEAIKRVSGWVYCVKWCQTVVCRSVLMWIRYDEQFLFFVSLQHTIYNIIVIVHLAWSFSSCLSALQREVWVPSVVLASVHSSNCWTRMVCLKATDF